MSASERFMHLRCVSCGKAAFVLLCCHPRAGGAIVVIVALAVLVVLGDGGVAGGLAGGTARAKLLQGIGKLPPKCTP